ncbi:MAG: DUF3795 domain-containing protein [Desulfovibrionales bacterium]
MAERFAAMDPVFEEYPSFQKILDLFARGSCSGCRTGACLLHECAVKDCVHEKGVNFCFECSLFPCEHSDFPPSLKKRWIEMNMRRREMGVEEYFRMMAARPRY